MNRVHVRLEGEINAMWDIYMNDGTSRSFLSCGGEYPKMDDDGGGCADNAVGEFLLAVADIGMYLPCWNSETQSIEFDYYPGSGQLRDITIADESNDWEPKPLAVRYVAKLPASVIIP